jgi:hypothetical protein
MNYVEVPFYWTNGGGIELHPHVQYLIPEVFGKMSLVEVDEYLKGKADFRSVTYPLFESKPAAVMSVFDLVRNLGSVTGVPVKGVRMNANSRYDNAVETDCFIFFKSDLDDKVEVLRLGKYSALVVLDGKRVVV